MGGIGDRSRQQKSNSMAEISKVNKVSDHEFASIVASSFTVKEVSMKLGYSSGRSARWRVTERINSQGLDVTHFRNWVQYGKVDTPSLLVKASGRNNQSIKKRVLEEGILKNVCVLCGNDGMHNGAPLVLHLDHIDGDNTNNELGNLRMLCPNCHSQTHTYGGRNKRKYGLPTRQRGSTP